jgi:nitrate reductase molybdenum cofactor assembly chaperone NarJ/NarW
MDTFDLLAEAFRYPFPGLAVTLDARLLRLPSGLVKTLVRSFFTPVQKLSLGEWEELYTRTFDLNPLAAPYVGFQIYGESYQRGEYMSRLSREMGQHAIDLGGELPDHLLPVLRYLGATPDPLPELVETLPPAIQRMQAVLRKAEPGNPYVHLLNAVEQACKIIGVQP